jgi:hypothetical protein
MIIVDKLNVGGVILTDGQMGIKMEFFIKIVLVVKIVL